MNLLDFTDKAEIALIHRILPCLNTIGIHSADADRSGTLLVDQGHQILIRFSSQHHLYNIHCFLICIA